jgi:hypothetical protein
MSGSVEFFFLAVLLLIICLFFLLLTSLFYAAVYILLRPFLEYIKPPLRAILIQLCALGAPVIAVTSTLFFISPAVFLLPTVYEHCHTSACIDHVPDFFKAPNLTVVIGVMLIGSFGFGLSVLIKQHRELHRKITSLCGLLSPNENVLEDKYLKIIDSKFPLVLNVGLVKPRIIMSNEVKRALGKSHFQLVLMYELIWCQRYTNLTTMMSKICTFAWPNFAKERLLGDLNQANHEAARLQLLGTKTPILVNKISDEILLPDYIKRLFESINAPVKKPMPNLFSGDYPFLMKNVGIAAFSLQHFIFIIFTTSILHLLADNFF